MARTNKCKVCQSTDPASGWVGTNHNLCGDCAKERTANRALQTINESTSRMQNPVLKSLMLGGMLGMVGALTPPPIRDQKPPETLEDLARLSGE